MAKARLINTKFRSDGYIIQLDPSEKLLFLYYLTNESTDLSGIYEIPLRRVSFDTGFDKDMILKIEKRFSENKKLYRFDDRVYVVNFVKNQSKNPSIEKGIQRSLENIPNFIKELVQNIQDGENVVEEPIDDSLSSEKDSLGQPVVLNLTKPNLTKLNLTIPDEIESPPPPKKELKSYGDFVKMTAEEYQKLIDAYGEKNIKSYIYKIDLYVGSRGKTGTYKDYYRTVLAWLEKDGIKKREQVKKHIPEEGKKLTAEEVAMNKSKLQDLKAKIQSK